MQCPLARRNDRADGGAHCLGGGQQRGRRVRPILCDGERRQVNKDAADPPPIPELMVNLQAAAQQRASLLVVTPRYGQQPQLLKRPGDALAEANALGALPALVEQRERLVSVTFMTGDGAEANQGPRDAFCIAELARQCQRQCAFGGRRLEVALQPGNEAEITMCAGNGPLVVRRLRSCQAFGVQVVRARVPALLARDAAEYLERCRDAPRICELTVEPQCCLKPANSGLIVTLQQRQAAAPQQRYCSKVGRGIRVPG